MKFQHTSYLAAFALAPIFALALTGCQQRHAGSAPSAAHDTAHAKAHWGYAGEVGPAHWSTLNPEYALCASGACQSPIDIVRPEPRDLDNPVFDYLASAISIINNGHTIQVNYDAGSNVTIDGTRFELVQFHFHAPSEHRVNGKPYPAELHLVHKSADGMLAVVGLLITAGRENAALAPVFSQLPATAGPASKAAGTVNAADILPAAHTSFRYGGSLTTPPCSERVSWTVLSTPIEMSPAQIQAFTSLYSGNNRPVQPLNSRAVVEDISK